MANDRNRTDESGFSNDSRNESGEDRLRDGVGEDVRGVADEGDEEFEDMDDLEDEDEEGDGAN